MLPSPLHLFFTQLSAFLISAINPSLSEEAESYKLETVSSQSQISTDVPESNADGFFLPLKLKTLLLLSAVVFCRLGYGDVRSLPHMAGEKSPWED